MPDDDRLTAIEIALTHQERLAEELGEVVRAQAARIDSLERSLAALASRLAALEAGGGGPLPDARPPHW